MYLWAKLFKKIQAQAVLGSSIDRTSKIEPGSNIVRVKMGRHSFCGYYCEISNANIGSFTSISDYVIIGGGTHPIDWVSMSPVFYEGRDSVRKKYAQHQRPAPLNTNIGHDVWIGHGVHIKQGVNIGTGAVVGMGSIVTRDVAPYSIVAGCPAKQIKMRFEVEVIQGLLKSKWWDYSDAKLEDLAPYVTDPNSFLERLGK